MRCKECKAPIVTAGFKNYCGQRCSRAAQARGKAKQKGHAERWRLRTKYGLTPEQHAEMVASAGGRCEICSNDGALCVDHCHTTGVVRGLLCTRCNLMLGMAKDNVEVLLASVAYLSRS